MVKKALTLCLFALLFCAKSAKAYIGVQNIYPQPDWMTATRYKSGAPTQTFRVDFYGNIMPGENNTNDIGIGTVAYKTGYFNSLSVASGVVNVHEHFLNIPSTDSVGWLVPPTSNPWGLIVTTSGVNLYTSSFTVAGVYISTNLWISNTNYITTDIMQASGPPRNVVIFSTFNGVNMGTTTLTGSATFYGIDALGKSNSENIAFSTTSGFQQIYMGTVAPSYIGIGSICWVSISSISIIISSSTPGLSASTASVMIGMGWKLGLSNVVTAPGDVYKVLEGTTSTSLSTSNYNTPLGIAVDNSFAAGTGQGNNVQFANPYTSSRSYDVWYKARKSTP